MLACAAIRGAPVSPREPPATSTWPEANLVESPARRGSSSSTAALDQPDLGLASARPAGCRCRSCCTSPAWRLAGHDPQPRLGRVEGDRHVGTHGRAGDDAARGVDAARHVDGTTAAPARVDERDRLAHGAVLAVSTSPAKPVPSSASTITLARSIAAPRPARSETGASPGSRSRFAAASPANSSGAATQHDRHLSPGSRSSRADDEPVAAVVALAADHRHRPLGACASTARATPAPARSIRSRPETPCSSIAQRSTRPHRLGVGQRLKPLRQALHEERC